MAKYYRVIQEAGGYQIRDVIYDKRRRDYHDANTGFFLSHRRQDHDISASISGAWQLRLMREEKRLAGLEDDVAKKKADIEKIRKEME